jgi:hypothetical protein
LREKSKYEANFFHLHMKDMAKWTRFVVVHEDEEDRFDTY